MRLLLAGDYEGIVGIAREQIAAGAHALDVRVAATERADEAAHMVALLPRLSSAVDVPLMIDSTEPSVIARALECIPGRAFVNSISLDGGRERLDAIVPLARAHGAAIVALTIDEQGMARTRERKLAVARRIYDIVVGEYGVPPDALLIDALVFALGTGDPDRSTSAIETIEAIRAVTQELPGVRTIVGISDVSYGLAARARPLLNAALLHHSVEAGLAAAIVNPAHLRLYAEIPEEERRLADDVIFNRVPGALQRFIAHVDGASPRARHRADQ